MMEKMKAWFWDTLWIVLRNCCRPKTFLSLRYRAVFHKKLDWNNPVSFSEKLQWMKVYGFNPEYTRLADKYLVKDWVRDTIGAQYIIPTLGVWDKASDIDFDYLPDRFVLKANHNSNGAIICKDKSTFDRDAARRELDSQLGRSYYKMCFETAYRDIRRKIIAEEYMQDEKTGELRDYKFFCFDGKVEAMLIASGRRSRLTMDYFDKDFNHLPFKRGHENADPYPEKPLCFEQMKELSSILSRGIPFVRVDLYEINGKIYFGEMTFYPASGMEPFTPEEWDYRFGEWLKLPEKR